MEHYKCVVGAIHESPAKVVNVYGRFVNRPYKSNNSNIALTNNLLNIKISSQNQIPLFNFDPNY